MKWDGKLIKILTPFFRLLGNFEEAAQDLRLACKIDFDEVADEWLKEVTPNVSPIHTRYTCRNVTLETNIVFC